MLKYSKLISALALAVALVPAAASARSGSLAGNAPANVQQLSNTQPAPVARNSAGRATQFDAPVGQKITQSPVNYADNNPIVNFDNFTG